MNAQATVVKAAFAVRASPPAYHCTILPSDHGPSNRR